MTGIIAAMSCEAELILNVMQNKAPRALCGITFWQGKVGGEDVVLATCGVGKVFAAACAVAMIMEFKPDRIINTGVAGAVSSEVNKLDTVVATALVQHDMDTTPLGDDPGLISGINKVFFETDRSLSDELYGFVELCGGKAKRGVVATGDQFVADNETKKRISTLFGASCADMEGGAIAQVCFVNNVPFAALRTMSDGADGDASGDFAEFCNKAAKISSNVLISYLNSIKA
ncbi:MAG: 5'-methylthioadenosine/adenosylhomocysteine nucleosidase [Clostridia bacterium]|nr:5'-methylthioadenosine/adenosylhomocysteine nucleosidase [Clostridia bacterium]